MPVFSNSKIILGLSGGVDSAVAALLLKEQGYDVEALFMKNWHDEASGNSSVSSSPHACSAAQDFADASAVCKHLHIPLHVVNFEHQYWQHVFQYTLDEYAKGRTPNPDVMCNKEIKFKAFLQHAQKLGAKYIATGHYARHVQVMINGKQCHQLHKAVDSSKDQSYFLCALTAEQLSSTLFPLGELNKTAVRALAKKAGLPNYAKKDSTGICFIGERRFTNFLHEYFLTKKGNIITPEGEVIGEHDGLMFYTLGQRQGLKLGGQRGKKEAPWYVVGKDLARNELVVAQDSEHPLLMAKTLICKEVNWISEDEPCRQRAGDPRPYKFECSAKIRYRQTDQPGVVTNIAPDTYQVTFHEAQRAITPGQVIAFYQGTECLGGGIIDK